MSKFVEHMANQNIAIGIDLGTANSKIAVNIDGKIEIVKKPGGVEYTPSVFGFDKSGNEVVGQKAYDHLYKLNEKGDNENYKAEVKRIMGTSKTIEFSRVKSKMTPEEISAEILKSLKEDLLRKYPDFDTNAVVITVPAAFSVLQSEATKRAGNLAGFEYVVLLQEPIAAAVSYGFMNTKNENWLIYDFGGGTFDLALVSCKDGVLSVLGHGGETFLGGKDIDWAIAENVIVPKIIEKYKFTDFDRSNKKYEAIFAHLKYLAESAKIELSQYAKTTIEVDEIGKDEAGKEVEISITFARSDFDKLIEPMINQTIELTKKTIKEAGLNEASIKKIVLVGGTSIIPFIREKLGGAFDIKIDSSVDPLTVVANGACIFAMGQKIPEKFMEIPKIKKGAHKITLNYTSLTSDTEESVTASIADLDDKSEYFVKIQSDSGTFTGPKTSIKSGKFYYTVKVQKNKSNLYWVYVFDNKSNPVEISPDSFTITHGLSVSGPPLPHSIRVIVAEQARNVSEPFFEKGDTLPLKKTLDVYKTSRKLRKGEDNELDIVIQEGESETPDRNDFLCKVGVKGKELPHDLPSGTPIELTVAMNESRELSVTAYIPLIDMSFNARSTIRDEEINTDDISTDLMVQRKRAEAVLENCTTEEKEKITNNIQSVSEGIKNSKLDEDEKRKANRQLKNLKILLDDIEEEKKMPQLVKEYNARIEYLQKVITEYADPRQKDDYKQQLEKIRADGDIAIKENNKDLLSRVNEELANTTQKAIYSNPLTYVSVFQQLVKADNFIDEKQAQYYINKGAEAIRNKDYDELKRCILQLSLMRPPDKQKYIDLAGITR
jgi:molecular chaperone DnaK